LHNKFLAPLPGSCLVCGNLFLFELILFFY